MPRKIYLLVNVLLLIIVFETYPQKVPPLAANPKYSFGVLAGYTRNFGVNVSGTISDFTYDLPLSIRLSAGYNVRDAGNPWDARKIFINDNTNGDPDKSGHTIDFRLDFALPVNLFSIRKSLLYIGPRYSMLTSTFEFIGGNEFFDITASQFGLGTGLDLYFGINPTLSFVVSGGFDYYFSNKVGGHDSFYMPDGTDINGRQGYSYDDAAKSVNLPKYEVRFMAGLSFGL
ncbi:MAG: hypothetical protein HND40_13270 [Ignavibacteriota bacterium]|nr:MAG: hypothetical protein F9K42_03355 [Ignavibacterium sp.]MBL1156084.1 hypothetical protein [Ignavibacteriota bacterium]MCO6446312.1 hypothetical protein [Ignavibacterium album]MCZ2270252.1 hypothetical protein [Ignavibacteriales bacterium]MDX9711705.1 hypothetical protein [Ignavibacteriaceae bacterium]